MKMGKLVAIADRAFRIEFFEEVIFIILVIYNVYFDFL